MHRKLTPKTRHGLALTALLGAIGTAMLGMPPASAATVEKTRFVNEYADAYTSTTSADGCIQSYVSASAGLASDGISGEMFYSTSTNNRCTGQWQAVWGLAPASVFDFKAHTLHAAATIPLSDGTQISLDLTWQGTGVTERSGSSSHDIVPGKFVQRTTFHGTIEEATVAGTLSFENALLSGSKGSSMLVSIDRP